MTLCTELCKKHICDPGLNNQRYKLEKVYVKKGGRGAIAILQRHPWNIVNKRLGIPDLE